LDESDLSAAERDGAAFAKSPRRTAGEYMIPITYEKHCRACHPLTIDESMLREAIPKGGQRIDVPHGLSPEQLGKFLKREFAAQFLKASPDLLKHHVPQHPLPGRPLVEESLEARQYIDNAVRGIEKYVQGRCAECHEVAGPVTKTPIAPTRVPSVWLKHARFDHAAHRAVSCQECHQAEYLYQPAAARRAALASIASSATRTMRAICHFTVRDRNAGTYSGSCGFKSSSTGRTLASDLGRPGNARNAVRGINRQNTSALHAAGGPAFFRLEVEKYLRPNLLWYGFVLLAELIHVPFPDDVRRAGRGRDRRMVPAGLGDGRRRRRAEGSAACPKASPDGRFRLRRRWIVLGQRVSRRFARRETRVA
jgi:hypothetical protein